VVKRGVADLGLLGQQVAGLTEERLTMSEV
jgi:hypothetical protein